MPVEFAALLFASRGIEVALRLWATVGQTLGMGLLLIELAPGSFARDPKVYNVTHSIIRFRPMPTELSPAIPKNSSLNIAAKKASFGYFGEDYGEISIHG